MRDGEKIVKLFGGRRIKDGWKFRCPCHKDENPSCVLYDSGWLKCYAGCDRKKIGEALDKKGFPDDGKSRRPTPEELAKIREGSIAEALELWADYDNPGMNTEENKNVVAYYLKERRGISLSVPSVMRRFRVNGWISCIQNLENEIVGVQYRAPGKGQKKRDGDPYTNGPYSGAAIHATEANGEDLGLAEGLETALSAFQMTQVPTWCSCGTDNLPKVNIPKHVKRIHIFVENNEPGIKAANKATEVFMEQGLHVRQWLLKKEYGDCNDYHQKILSNGKDHGAESVHYSKGVHPAFESVKNFKPKTNRKIAGKTSMLVLASEVRMRAKRWLWRGHLLRGAQELLTGIPGLGKSQVQCSYIASSTAMVPWPNGDQGTTPTNVIMITAEDTLDQEVVPRLVAAGADLNRVHILKHIKIDEKTRRQFLLTEDLGQLARDVTRIGDVGLVTIDPLTAYMGGKVDSHKTTEVRSQLGPLKDFAETYDVAVSTITHPAKNAGQRAIDHFIGSQAFIAAGRIGHVCVAEMRDDENSDQMVPTGRVLFTHAKHNPSIKMPTLAYRISSLVVGRDEESGENIDAPRVVWEEGPNITADEAVGMSLKKNSSGAQSKVQDFLKTILTGGKSVPQKYIIEEGKQRHGFTEKQLRTAKAKLGVGSDKLLDGWVWVLPAKSTS